MKKAVTITALSHFGYAVATKFSTLIVLLLAQRNIDSRDYLILVTVWASFQIIRSTIGLPLSFYSVGGSVYKRITTIDAAYISIIITGVIITLYNFDSTITAISIFLVVIVGLIASFSTYLFGIILGTNPKVAWLSILANVTFLSLGLVWFSQASTNNNSNMYFLWLLVLAIIDLPILIAFTSIRRKTRFAKNMTDVELKSNNLKPTKLYYMAIAMTSMQIANYAGLVIAESFYPSQSEAYAVGHQLRAVALVFSGTINISAARWATQTNFSNTRLLLLSVILYAVFLVSSISLFGVFNFFEIILIDDSHKLLIAITTASAAAFATVMMQTCYLFGKRSFSSSATHALCSTATYLLPLSIAHNLHQAVALQCLCVIPSTILFFILINIDNRATVNPISK